MEPCTEDTPEDTAMNILEVMRAQKVGLRPAKHFDAALRVKQRT
jgi:hypothetical protein